MEVSDHAPPYRPHIGQPTGSLDGEQVFADCPLLLAGEPHVAHRSTAFRTRGHPAEIHSASSFLRHRTAPPRRTGAGALPLLTYRHQLRLATPAISADSAAVSSSRRCSSLASALIGHLLGRARTGAAAQQPHRKTSFACLRPGRMPAAAFGAAAGSESHGSSGARSSCSLLRFLPCSRPAKCRSHGGMMPRCSSEKSDTRSLLSFLRDEEKQGVPLAAGRCRAQHFKRKRTRRNCRGSVHPRSRLVFSRRRCRAESRATISESIRLCRASSVFSTRTSARCAR